MVLNQTILEILKNARMDGIHRFKNKLQYQHVSTKKIEQTDAITFI